MIPFEMLHVVSGAEFERMKNVQPEKSLPLKSSTTFESGAFTANDHARQEKIIAKNNFAVPFMAAKMARRQTQVKFEKPIFARARKRLAEKSRSNIQWDFSRCKPISCRASRAIRCAKHFQAGRKVRCGAVR